VPNFAVGDNVFYKPRQALSSQPLTGETLADHDVVVIVTGHHTIDYQQVLDQADLVVDSCHATGDMQGKAKIVKLGTPMQV
jgi:UDP-N-acetyl-D-mannosaminuronate dehydrogenase